MACDGGLPLDEDILRRLLFLASYWWTSKPHSDLPLQWYLWPDPLSHCIYVWCRQHCCVNMSWWRMCCQRTLVRGKISGCDVPVCVLTAFCWSRMLDIWNITNSTISLCVFWCFFLLLLNTAPKCLHAPHCTKISQAAFNGDLEGIQWVSLRC